MLTLFTEAWSSDQDIDVLLVLGAVKCGLYSRNELTAKNCIQLLLKMIISLKRTNQAAKYDNRISKWFTQVT